MHKKERDRHWPFVLNLEQYWSFTSFACLTLEVYNILLDIERNLHHFHSVGISLRTFPISSELFVYSSFEKCVYGANTVRDLNGKISIFDRGNQIDKLTIDWTLVFIEFITNCTYWIWRSVHFILILYIQATQQLLVFGHRSPLGGKKSNKSRENSVTYGTAAEWECLIYAKARNRLIYVLFITIDRK